MTSLRRWIETVYLHDLLAIPFCFIGKHINKSTPACISNGLGKTMISRHTLYIQIFDTNGIISSNKRYRTLMQVVNTTVTNLFVKFGNFESLVFKPSAAFLFARKMLLCFSKFALVSSCISVIIKSFSFRSDKQILQTHIQAN